MQEIKHGQDSGQNDATVEADRTLHFSDTYSQRAFLDLVASEKRDNTVVVLEGPPRSGKSCLRQMIKDIIKADPEARQSDLYPYVITACPDGEGAWFQEAAGNDPDLARQLKEAYKAKFTPEFVRRVSESVENCQVPLTFVDPGGITSDENRRILKTATHAVIITSDPARIEEWQKLNEELGIKTIAILQSDYHGTEDRVDGFNGGAVLHGSIHHLERGEDLTSRPAGKALCDHIVKIALARKELADYRRQASVEEREVGAVLEKIEALALGWQQRLGSDVKVVLGGSLVSGTFVMEGAKCIDVDVRFLADKPSEPGLIERIEQATGLKYRKTIEVSDWPSGKSVGHMIEGNITAEGVALPLDVEGCLRSKAYVGWHQYYREVFSPEELQAFREQKLMLRDNKVAYKAFKASMREECQSRAVERGLVPTDRSPYAGPELP